MLKLLGSIAADRFGYVSPNNGPGPAERRITYSLIRKQNINCRIMRQLIFPVAKKAKRLGGKRHVLIQATLSTKLNGRTEWTVADAAVLFKEPVEDLVSDFAIEAISGGSEYQLNQNGSVDISRRDLRSGRHTCLRPQRPSARRRAK